MPLPPTPYLPLVGFDLAGANNLPGWPAFAPRLGDLLNLLGGLGAYKSADQGVSSDNVLTEDSELFIDGIVPGRYQLDAALFFDIPADGVQVALDGTIVTPSMKVQGLIYDTQIRSSTRLTALGASVTHSAAGPGAHAVTLQGTIEVTTGGRLGIYWAQNTSNPATLTLQRNSYLRLWIISPAG